MPESSLHSRGSSFGKWHEGMFCVEWVQSAVGFGCNAAGRAVAADTLHDFIL